MKSPSEIQSIGTRSAAEGFGLRRSTGQVGALTAPERRARAALLALITGALLIAFAPIFTKQAMVWGHIGPVTAAFWRTALATPLLLLALAGTEGKRRPRFALRASQGEGKEAGRRSRASWYSVSPYLLIPGVLFAADLSFWHWSFQYTTVGNATLLGNAASIFVGLAGWLWLHERFTWTFPVGVAAAFGGAALVMGASFSIDPHRVIGDGLALVTALFYAAYLLSIKQLRAHHSTLRVMAWSTAACAAVLLPLALLIERQFFPTGLNAWMQLVALAWLCHAGGQGLIAYALAHLPAGFSGVSLVVQPVGAVFLGWVILGEAMTPWQIAGAAVVLCGIALARVGSKE